MEIVAFLFKWLHVLAGIVWMGMLYYFNFVQAEYFKEAESAALSDAKAKLAPRALKWFARGAEITLVTGVILLVGIGHKQLLNEFVVLGAFIGLLMFINVVAIIVPKQKVVLGLRDGDVASAAVKASRASRTNVLFSAPMLFCMVASPHLGYSSKYLLASGVGAGFFIAVALIIALEVNALFGKVGPMASIRGVIYSSFGLSALIYCLTLFM